MRKVTEIYWLDESERDSPYKTGFRFVLEDGTIIEPCTTDVIAPDILTRPAGRTI